MQLPKHDGIRIVTPSRMRHEVISKRTFGLFPSAIVCVEDTEYDDYAKYVPEKQILPHPKFGGYGEIYNWILETVPDEVIFIPDDDIVCGWSYVGRRTVKYTDPKDALQIVINSANIAKTIGARQWGYGASPNPISYSPFNSLDFVGVCCGASGVIGKNLGHDTKITLVGDADFSLQQLIKNRIVYIDLRYHFATVQFMTQAGGNTAYRSEERLKKEHDFLKRKWGKYIGEGTIGVTKVQNVKRRQS